MLNRFGRVFLSEMSGLEQIQHLMVNTLISELDAILISLWFVKLEHKPVHLNIFFQVLLKGIGIIIDMMLF